MDWQPIAWPPLGIGSMPLEACNSCLAPSYQNPTTSKAPNSKPISLNPPVMWEGGGVGWGGVGRGAGRGVGAGPNLLALQVQSPKPPNSQTLQPFGPQSPNPLKGLDGAAGLRQKAQATCERPAGNRAECQGLRFRLWRSGLGKFWVQGLGLN